MTDAAPLTTPSTTQASTKDAALADDIRLLGRLLGDVIREHEGEEAFALIESIRQLSVASRKLDDEAAHRELTTLLEGLTDEQSVRVARAFSFFSQLANIAEDHHHTRRHRLHRREGSAPLPASLGGLAAELAARGLHGAEAARFMAGIQVSPVLTAHPTEVQRKSILDCQLSIADLLSRLSPENSASLLAEEKAALETGLRRAITTLWHTRMLRDVKLGVKDEIENALAYFDYTFLQVLPALQCALEDMLAAPAPLPPVVRMGSWVGGDRDGNPFVTAEMLDHALKRRARSCSIITSARSMRWVPTCRCHRCCAVAARHCWHWRSAHPTARRIVRMNPIAAR